MIKKRLLFVALLTFGLISSCREQSGQEVAEQIRKSEHLSRLDSLCEKLPIPPNLVLLNKQIQGNSGKDSLSFYYEKKSPGESVDFTAIDRWLSANGWVSEADFIRTYKNGKQTVTVSTATGKASYAITCSEHL